MLKILRPEEVSDEKNLVSSAREAITYIMKIAQNSLFMKGIIKLQKKEIVDTFEREYSPLEHKEVVREAYELQLSWKQIFMGNMDSQRLMDFIKEVRIFTQYFKSLLVQEQSQN